MFRKQLYFRNRHKICRFYYCLAGRQERTLFSVYNVAAVTLARIALAVEVDINYLLGLTDDPARKVRR